MMEVAEILSRFERLNRNFEREAVDAAIARREEVTPELLSILEKIADTTKAESIAEDRDYMAHLYAMHLLAQFRESRAFPLVLQIARLNSDLLESLFGDFITDTLGNVLASLCDGQTGEIQAIVEDGGVDEWVRCAALGSLVTLVRTGAISREELLDYFAGLFRGKLTDKNEVVWSDLVCCSTDLYATGLLGDIERAYEEGLIDESMIALEDVREDFAKGEQWALDRLASDRHRHPIDDTVMEMSWWYCFEENKQRERYRQSANAGLLNEEYGIVMPYKRTEAKIGRNDPCPCGSGRKYKKCCGSQAGTASSA